MSFSINERLLRGLNQEKKQEFITAYKANSWMLRTMKSILEREIEMNGKEQTLRKERLCVI